LQLEKRTASQRLKMVRAQGGDMRVQMGFQILVEFWCKFKFFKPRIISNYFLSKFLDYVECHRWLQDSFYTDNGRAVSASDTSSRTNSAPGHSAHLFRHARLRTSTQGKLQTGKYLLNEPYKVQWNSNLVIFCQVESELIDKLDVLVGENKGDDNYKELFNTM
jgi:dedicator of cytokinesis protein 3